MAFSIGDLLHVDQHIRQLIQDHGTAAYGILGAIVFCETGLVVTPFLPGDSLLFAAGIFCHPDKDMAGLNVGVMFGVFCLAALTGDNVNYWIGRLLGHRLFRSETSRVFKKSHLEKTHEFFERHGKITVVLARFVPVVRTFAPFVAGMGEMPYREFIGYSVLGAVLWVGLFLFGGFFIGQFPVVKNNFGVAVLLMVIVTGAPLVWEVYKARREQLAKRQA